MIMFYLYIYFSLERWTIIKIQWIFPTCGLEVKNLIVLEYSIKRILFLGFFLQRFYTVLTKTIKLTD